MDTIKIPDEFICPISMTIMFNPVRVRINDRISHCYCSGTWSKINNCRDPYTQIKITDENISIDYELEAKIQKFLDENPAVKYNMDENPYYEAMPFTRNPAGHIMNIEQEKITDEDIALVNSEMATIQKYADSAVIARAAKFPKILELKKCNLPKFIYDIEFTGENDVVTKVTQIYQKYDDDEVTSFFRSRQFKDKIKDMKFGSEHADRIIEIGDDRMQFKYFMQNYCSLNLVITHFVDYLPREELNELILNETEYNVENLTHFSRINNEAQIKKMIPQLINLDRKNLYKCTRILSSCEFSGDEYRELYNFGGEKLRFAEICIKLKIYRSSNQLKKILHIITN